MSGLPPELDISGKDPFSKGKLDIAFGWITSKIRALEAFSPEWTKAVDELRAFGLQRINEAIMPAYQRVMDLAKFGFLLANSETRCALAVGDRRIFTIDDESQRSLFTPTAFVTISRVSNSADWAIACVEHYDVDTGLLTVIIEAAEVGAGMHDDWQITATAGTAVAVRSLLADTRAARDATIAIRNETAGIKLSAIYDVSAIRDAAQVARLAAEKAANDANAAALLIEGGPVASVNGETGNIQLTQDSIPNLVGDLASKADKQTTVTALADRYTKGETESKLSLKADKTSLALKHDVGAGILSMTGYELLSEPAENRVTLRSTDDPGIGTHLYIDGNIYGSAWGGFLSNWVLNQLSADRTWAYGSFVTDVRLAGWWEGGLAPNSWNYDPGSGAVVTALYAAAQTMGGAAIAHRGGRFLQKMIGGQWYAVGSGG